MNSKNFDQLEIKENENILVNSDIQKKFYFIIKKENKFFDPNIIIDGIIEILGNNGTLMFPTYNWDFCEGKIFDYNHTPSKSGSLSKVALKELILKDQKILFILSLFLGNIESI